MIALLMAFFFVAGCLGIVMVVTKLPILVWRRSTAREIEDSLTVDLRSGKNRDLMAAYNEYRQTVGALYLYLDTGHTDRMFHAAMAANTERFERRMASLDVPPSQA